MVKELSIWDTLSLCAILTSHPMEEAVTKCTGEIAQSLINLIQAVRENFIVFSISLC